VAEAADAGVNTKLIVRAQPNADPRRFWHHQAVRFSIVIPTYQRRDIVVRMVVALDRQLMRGFEVVVVVDGSTDGTTAALRDLTVTFPLTVIEQRNQGRAAACNAGARAADGEVLLFLDDDMEADPRLLAEHESSREQGADVVFGHLALHRDSPPNLMSDGIERWARSRLARLTEPRAKFAMDDYLTGQMSVPREVFHAVGGFDVTLTRDGLFGGEDLDFGYRLARAGHGIVFNPEAITYQLYVVDPEEALRRSRQAGRSQQELIFKHPAWAADLGRDLRHKSGRARVLGGALALAPPAASWPLRALSVGLVRAGKRGYPTRRLFSAMFNADYKRGARQARRSWRTASVHVLAYHAVADLSGNRILAPYGVPPAQLASHLDSLLARGRKFVDLDTVLRGLTEGTFIPEGATLLTFDDAYADLSDAVKTILEPRGIPAVVFAVSSEVGGTNSWDRDLGAATLPLLGPEALRDLGGRGVAVGSHGATHRSLVSMPATELEAELRESADQLTSLGLPRPVALAYSYGQWDPDVATAAQAAGYVLAFTVAPGVVRRGTPRHSLPRIEVHASDSPRDLSIKLMTATWPAWARRLAMWRPRGPVPRVRAPREPPVSSLASKP
jgi:GT2 family glycosyltransferase/peptidoglycan/xylan/chitin deacetylase (PgdA/CDA1 family)